MQASQVIRASWGQETKSGIMVNEKIGILDHRSQNSSRTSNRPHEDEIEKQITYAQWCVHLMHDFGAVFKF